MKAIVSKITLNMSNCFLKGKKCCRETMLNLDLRELFPIGKLCQMGNSFYIHFYNVYRVHSYHPAADF
jgi:hypothetical protein